MKTSGSPCPLDQIYIICFKRCPYLRSYLTELIQAVWLSGNIPEEWKKACTILIHKKDNSDSPSNFRPITLQTIPLITLQIIPRRFVVYNVRHVQNLSAKNKDNNRIKPTCDQRSLCEVRCNDKSC